MDNKILRNGLPTSEVPCEIIQDLLPLYCDNACSPASRAMVEEHLAFCDKCQALCDMLNDQTMESAIIEESSGVLARHAKKEKTAAFKAGLIIAGILMLPVIIAFVVTLATEADIGSFFVLTASMLMVGAVTVVPLVSGKNKFAKMILCAVGALLLIYFFVDRMNGGGCFLLWSVPTVFGLSLVLFPFVIRAAELPPVLTDKKAVITGLWDTAFLYLTVFIVSINGMESAEAMRVGFIVSTIFVVLFWAILLVCRYLKACGFFKAGIAVALCGVWTGFATDIANMLLGPQQASTTDTTVNMICLIVGLAAGIALCIIGYLRSKRNM